MKTIIDVAQGMLGLAVQRAGSAKATPQDANAFDFSFTAIDGAPLPLAYFRGKVLLVVNTASLCGFTRQYSGLEALWQTYRDRGLVVIGAPCNDFAVQEPKNNSEISAFCQTRFGVSFPLTEKIAVRGPGAHPFYNWAANVAGSKGTPKWNFHKYLIARHGRLVAWFPASTLPDSKRLKRAIEHELEY